MCPVREPVRFVLAEFVSITLSTVEMLSASKLPVPKWRELSRKPNQAQHRLELNSASNRPIFEHGNDHKSLTLDHFWFGTTSAASMASSGWLTTLTPFADTVQGRNTHVSTLRSLPPKTAKQLDRSSVSKDARQAQDDVNGEHTAPTRDVRELT